MRQQAVLFEASKTSTNTGSRDSARSDQAACDLIVTGNLL